MQYQGWVITDSVVVLAIANYIADLLENTLSSSVIKMWCVHKGVLVCRQGKISVGQVD
jgi:hypothetical protein